MELTQNQLCNLASRIVMECKAVNYGQRDCKWLNGVSWTLETLGVSCDIDYDKEHDWYTAVKIGGSVWTV